MKVESFRFKGQEINLPVFDDDEIEKNDIEDETLENTADLNKLVKDVETYE